MSFNINKIEHRSIIIKHYAPENIFSPAVASLLCGQALAAPTLPANADIRDSGFVYCVSGQVNTFNPQKSAAV